MTESATSHRKRLDAATANLDPVFAVVDLDAYERNAADLVRRAGGLPIRLASKSVRVRELLHRTLQHDGYRGILAFTLPEALWLRSHEFTDIVVAYPTAHREAIRALTADTATADAVTIMVDDIAQLDLVDSLVQSRKTDVRVCLDLDASWRPIDRVHIGVRRSPLHSPEQLAEIAAKVARRPGFDLVGVMSYEAQIAGLGNAPAGRRVYATAVRALQKQSATELANRRRDAVCAVEAELAAAGKSPLEFVNGGGTGSLERTAAEGVSTEVAAGSGLFGPTLFDTYAHFTPEPAMAFATSVVRRPSPGRVVVLGGGYLASGPADRARLPTPWLPLGLHLINAEGAGEVQTPLTGRVADDLDIGDRVWFRHAKAGEACERFNSVALLRGVTGAGDPRVEEVVPTYRGEGMTFL